ncbi:hypothetical protein K1719_009633 [Acacia pycnantha]|nr:hypothetical protein K1719_009633 [Acacia pycnantha]
MILVSHSPGASLSILYGFDPVENGVIDVPVCAFVFGSPQVGNRAFNKRFKKFPNLKVLHFCIRDKNHDSNLKLMLLRSPWKVLPCGIRHGHVSIRIFAAIAKPTPLL